MPLHESQDRWYDRRRTYCGAHSHIYAPLGYLLPTQVTMGSGDAPMPALSMTLPTELTLRSELVTVTNWSAQMGDDGMEYTGTYHDLMGDITVRLRILGAYNARTIAFTCNHNDEVLFDDGSGSTATFTDAELLTMTNKWVGYGTSPRTVFLMNGTMGISATLVNIADGTETAVSLPYSLTVIPTEQRSTSRFYAMEFGGVMLSGSWPVGAHYMKITVGGTQYVGEPFEWLDDVSRLLHITYSRSRALMAAGNYMPFNTAMEVWLDAHLMKPEYYGSVEQSVDNGGVTFVEELVTYKQHCFALGKCTEYMADALSLLCHCDEVEVEYDGVEYDSLLFDPVEVSWEESNHFCQVDCRFRTDTIVQSNGTTTQVIRSLGGAYDDGSFSNSFDNQ